MTQENDIIRVLSDVLTKHMRGLIYVRYIPVYELYFYYLECSGFEAHFRQQEKALMPNSGYRCTIGASDSARDFDTKREFQIILHFAFCHLSTNQK